MSAQEEIMREAKRTGKTVFTITPNIYGAGHTEWTATPNEHGAVELTYKIIKTT